MRLLRKRMKQSSISDRLPDGTSSHGSCLARTDVGTRREAPLTARQPAAIASRGLPAGTEPELISAALFSSAVD